jgi:hypothetical protein
MILTGPPYSKVQSLSPNPSPILSLTQILLLTVIGHQSNQYPYDKRQNSMGRPQGSGYQGFISNGYQGQHPRDIGSSKYNHSK